MQQLILPVTAALIRQDDLLLLTERRPGTALAGHWELPGGKLEFGEHPEVCICRELREELGLEATVLGLQGVYSHVRDQHCQVLLLVYDCHPGELVPRSLEGQRFCWASPQEALGLNLLPLDREIVQRLVAVDE